MLALTDTAVKALRQAIDRAENQALGLRIMVESGGCAGLKYMLGLEASPHADDAVIEQDGVRVFVDPKSQAMLEGVRVDYVDSLQGAGFVFENPNASKACSCGKSFAS